MKGKHKAILNQQDSDLYTAVIQKRLTFVYQAIVCSISGMIKGYESLLRISRLIEGEELISASPYIEQSERNGSYMHLRLDEFVLENAIQELSQNPELVLSINISNMVIANGSWLKHAKQLLVQRSVALRLIIEITETGSFCNIAIMKEFISEVQSLGCKVALDDFGTGIFSEACLNMSSFSILGADLIKIDGQYIKDIVDNKVSRAFVQSVVDFAQQHQIQTVAEYVSNAEIAETVCNMGVDYMQGYYLSTPKPKPWIKE